MKARIVCFIKNQPIKRLIIQSNDNLCLLRKTMTNRNYYICDEKIIFEDNKYYIIIQYESGFKEYTEYELLLGPKLLQSNNDIFRQYLNNLLKHFQNVLLEIPTSYLDRRNEINKIIDYIEMALK